MVSSGDVVVIPSLAQTGRTDERDGNPTWNDVLEFGPGGEIQDGRDFLMILSR